MTKDQSTPESNEIPKTPETLGSPETPESNETSEVSAVSKEATTEVATETKPAPTPITTHRMVTGGGELDDVKPLLRVYVFVQELVHSSSTRKTSLNIFLNFATIKIS